MRTFVIFPKDRAEKVKASTRIIAIRRYLKTHPLMTIGDVGIALDSQVSIGTNDTKEITEIKEQGVVITETPKPTIYTHKHDPSIKVTLTACDPEDMKPEHKDVN